MDINNKDSLTMRLVHYFITKRNYNPVIIKGVDNEIWLENKREEYGIIRIVTKEIFNNEQYDFDTFKIKNILSQIKRKTFNPFLKVITIYTEVGENFNKEFEDSNKYKYVVIRDEKDIENNELLKKYYKDISDGIKFKEEGYELIQNIVFDINKKNLDDSIKVNDMMKSNKPIITYILIGINIVLFILMYVLGNGSEDNTTLVNFGANYIPLTLSGEVYRLLSSAFLHIGIIHILCNMYSLFIVGPNIENFYGKGKFILIYLYSAIIGSLLAVVFAGPNDLYAGASGAIFGLLGSLLYFGYAFRGYIGNAIINQVLPVVVVNLIIGFIIPGISNTSHIGGFIGGIAMSYMLCYSNEKDKYKIITGLIINLLLTAFLVYLAFFR